MAAGTSLKSLAGGRLAIGVTMWVAPRIAGRLFGLDPAHNPQLPYVGRLFAVRDVALGVGVLRSEGRARRDWLALGLACDAADLAAAVLAYRAGEIGPLTAALLVGTPISAIGAGAAALREGDAAPTQA